MNNTNIDDDPQARTRTQERLHERGASARRAEPAHREAARKSRIEMDRLREVGRNLGEQLDEQVRKRPYVVLGAAAGAGFVAGSILGSRLGQVLLAAGVGYAAKHVLGGEFGLDRLQAGLERLTGEFEAKAERGSGRS
jgi:ElaB/YqjD/DUF883 family membrane-anchored ribosome-binding protein